MRLDSITEKITLTCAGAHTTTPGDIVASWDVSDPAASPKFNSGSNVAVTAGTSSVDVIPVPLSGTARVSVEEISVTNNDTAPMTVTIFHTNTTGPVNRRVFGPCTLQVGEKIQFKAANGWTVFTVTGAVKVTAVASTVEPGYIDGSKMIWNSGTSITIDSGSFYIPSVGANVNVAAPITKAGLALAANTWYHVYGFLNSGVPDFEVVTTAPSSPYNGTARTKSGDTTRRYIGSIRAIAAGAVAKFEQDGLEILYLENINTAPFLVVAGGTATVATTVSCSAAVPVTSKNANLLANNNATAAVVYLSNSNAVNPLSTTFWLGFLSALQTLPRAAFPLNSAQEFQYMYDVAPVGQFFARVVGYVYER